MSDRGLLQLEQERMVAEGMIADKLIALQQIVGQLESVIAKLIEADPEARPQLIERRWSLVAERDALTDEIVELEHRRDSSYLAYYLLQEEQAQVALETARREAAKARQARDAAAGALRRFQAGRDGKTYTREERETRYVELETEAARCKAESVLAGRVHREARNRWEAAQRETEQARQQVAA